MLIRTRNGKFTSEFYVYKHTIVHVCMFVIASTTNNDVRKENTNFMKELIHLLHLTIKEHTQRWNNSNRVLGYGRLLGTDAIN